jgi:diguanylate cyclase (GGDEF)-like protein
MTVSTASWATLQLAEFLEIFGDLRSELVEARAVERVVESVDAEFGAYVEDGRVVAATGFSARQPVQDVVDRALVARRGAVEVEGFGKVHLLVAPAGEAHLVVLRLAEPFDRDEETLIRSMGRALGLATRLARSQSENDRLLTRLRERQSLAARLFRIQQSISHRAPLQEVLDALTAGGADLLDADVVGVRVRVGAEQASFVATSGARLDPDRPAVWNPGTEVELGDGTRAELRAVIAAPIVAEGQTVGTITVASVDPDRSFTEAEQDVLRSLADHAAIAVSDAAQVHRLRASLDDATYQATHDALTGLLNRPGLIRALDEMLAAGQVATVLFVDVDRFKVINDVMGHATGDRVLVEVASRLCAVTRAGDLVGRLAGDEFVVVAGTGDPVSTAALADRVIAEVGRPIDLGHREVVLTVSVGVAAADGARSGEELLVDADVAMYRAKQGGRARVVCFDAEMRREMTYRSELERELTHALRDQQFVVHYQPTLDLADDTIAGFEALVRWNHPTRGLLAPGEFVPLAEEAGQIAQIDTIVLREATRQLAEWQRLDPSLAGLGMSVNLSARQFTDPDLVAKVATALADAGVEPHTLWLEITESVVMDETNATLEILRSLRQLGARLMVDDFGTGYSSLVYLKRFPVDALKIDRGFVDGLGVDIEDEAIVRAVIGLAEALGLQVVAEGVETARQLDQLRRLRCGMAQGFLFSPPVPAEVATELLTRPPVDSRRWHLDGVGRSSPSPCSPPPAPGTTGRLGSPATR